MLLSMLAQPASRSALFPLRFCQGRDVARLVPPAGVIPIDRLTDVRAPVEVVTQRVSREQLERVYAFRLPKPEAEDDVPGRWGPQWLHSLRLKSGVAQGR